MTLFTDNVNALVEMSPRRRLRGDTGRLDADGSINQNPTVGLETGKIWVRLRGERGAIAVWNINTTTQRANIPVILEELDGGEYQILQADPEPAFYTYGDFAPGLNQGDKPPEQEKSSVFHKRIGDLRLRLSSTGGLVLTLNKGVYQKIDGTKENFDGGDIDLTASVPAVVDTKRIVLIGLDSSNAQVQSAATAVDQSTTLTIEPYFTLEEFVTAANAATSTTSWLWALPMLAGQTTFLNTDTFIDLRPIIYAKGTLPIAQGGTGQTTQTAAFDALSPTTTKGDVIASNGSDNVRLPVGSTNGMVLSVDSSTVSGLAWTATGATFSATLTTTNATPTDILAYPMALSSAVTIQARIVGAKSDYTASLSARITVGFRRAAAGAPVMIGTGDVYQETDSLGGVLVAVAPDAVNNTGDVVISGEAAATWNWKIEYTIMTQV
jgi:hypothetical protein